MSESNKFILVVKLQSLKSIEQFKSDFYNPLWMEDVRKKAFLDKN